MIASTAVTVIYRATGPKLGNIVALGRRPSCSAIMHATTVLANFIRQEIWMEYFTTSMLSSSGLVPLHQAATRPESDSAAAASAPPRPPLLPCLAQG